MQPTDNVRKRVPRTVLFGFAVLLAAIALTAAYSRWAPEAGDTSLSPIAASAADPLATNGAVPKAAAASSEQGPRMVVTFRLDPAVTRGLYLGDRWVSPEAFHFVQPGTQYVVQAKLQSVDARDERIDLSGNWSTDDPQMIAIERHGYGEVTIVVRQSGEGRLFVSAGGETKVLHVQARQTEDAMDVRIVQ